MKLDTKQYMAGFPLSHQRIAHLSAVGLFLLCLLLAGSLLSCAPQMQPGAGRSGIQQSSSSKEWQPEATGQTITFQVDQDGASKRITWVSSQPAGRAMLICFEKNDNSIVICTDVEQGKISGVLYAFSSMPVEECTARFRPVQ